MRNRTGIQSRKKDIKLPRFDWDNRELGRYSDK